MNANRDPMINSSLEKCDGILLVDKPAGKTSFSLVGALRRLLGERKIGHAGTLDPFATGVMVMLIGRSATRLSDQFLCSDKEYIAEVHLGKATDTYDCDGEITFTSPLIPSQDQIFQAVQNFQGEIDQVPPMHSAKKVNGKKLYELARKGQVIERLPVKVRLETEILSYTYPLLTLRISCSKGTYIRSVADDLGKLLGCGAHLSALKRTRSGKFKLEECFNGSQLYIPTADSHSVRQAITKISPNKN